MVYFPDRRIDSKIYDHKIVNELLHFAIRTLLLWKHSLGVTCIDRPRRNFFNRLPENLRAFTHLLHPDVKSGKGITICVNRNIEIEVIVNKIRLIAAQVMTDAASPQCWACESDTDCLFF